MTAAELRRDLSQRSLHWAEHHLAEHTPAHHPAVLFAPAPDGSHGNFIPASWRRIERNPLWRARLGKAYTSSARLPHSRQRRRAELDCATSSDALLMNVFCYPALLRRPAVCALLGILPGLRPRFGVRLRSPLHRGLSDRTEADLLLGDLLLEAKLTETDFQTAPLALLQRYPAFDAVFAVDDLPRSPLGHIRGYQLLRSVLAAHTSGRRFAVLCDRRRDDLIEQWFHILRTVQIADLRARLQLVTWQELAAVAPPRLQLFLAEKYGIVPRS